MVGITEKPQGEKIFEYSALVDSGGSGLIESGKVEGSMLGAPLGDLVAEARREQPGAEIVVESKSPEKVEAAQIEKVSETPLVPAVEVPKIVKDISAVNAQAPQPLSGEVKLVESTTSASLAAKVNKEKTVVAGLAGNQLTTEAYDRFRKVVEEARTAIQNAEEG